MKKGFTLIELLVVIAIIALLSSVILASLGGARDKSANTAVKANLNNLRAQAALYCGDGNTPCTAVCGDAVVTSMMNAAKTAGGGTAIDSPCNGAPGAWAASAKLKVPESGNAYWCVDSTGSSRGINSVPGGSVCP